jgi:hypothetical protein
MYTTINLTTFRNAFQEVRPNNFTYEGLESLFDYLEQLEDDLGEKIELDVIALCCDYVEQTLEEFNRDYAEDEKMSMEEAIEYLCENTHLVAKTSNETLIYLQF